ncbi:cobalamin B12-binding domain-containing protein [Desulfospira joergensenii]|uniref:cobalamin B12-binding domain-containing protein n=1 Tax=Desulfospira joergensenii TaxID=53329 RepID=UPI0003B78051|nr:B12-binding domain-containing protein [Desulfospira joergensenii]
MMDQAIIDDAGQSLVKGSKDGAIALAREILDKGIDPVTMMDEAFIPGINQVGELFGRGQLFLPELIMAADAMKAVTDVVNETISSQAVQKEAKGKILIATVKGDVHDIGKCIVTSLFQANGFTVHDMGRDIDTEKILEEAVRLDVDIIGTSALLTTTMPKQKDLEELLKRKGLKDRFKTMVGGAPVTPRWATRIGADAYAEDAQDGVCKAEELLGLS